MPPATFICMDRIFIIRERGVSRPFPAMEAWLAANPPLALRMAGLGMLNPGLHAAILAVISQEGWPRTEVEAFLEMPWRQQLGRLELPQTKGFLRLLGSLDFHAIESPDRLMNTLRSVARQGLPKAIQHCGAVGFPYLEALARCQSIGELPQPEKLNLNPYSDAEMGRLLHAVLKCCICSANLGRSRAWLHQRFRTVRTARQFRAIQSNLRHLEWQRRAVAENWHVEVPLEPREGIWAPRTLREFQMLGRLQGNCVADYFAAARAGKGAIYAVLQGNRPVMTVELRPGADGLWMPEQMLAVENTLPRPAAVKKLLHWLATEQTTLDGDFSYNRNLLRLMRWIAENALQEEARTEYEVHWSLQAHALSELLSEWSRNGHAGQLSLPLTKPSRVAGELG